MICDADLALKEQMLSNSPLENALRVITWGSRKWGFRQINIAETLRTDP